MKEQYLRNRVCTDYRKLKALPQRSPVSCSPTATQNMGHAGNAQKRPSVPELTQSGGGPPGANKCAEDGYVNTTKITFCRHPGVEEILQGIKQGILLA